LESLRHFDPLTQISRDEIKGVTIPPGGELGLLKKQPDNLGTLLDYLPSQSIFLLCESEQVDTRAEEYAIQVPPGDPFFISWEEFKTEAVRKGITLLGVDEGETDLIQSPNLNDPGESETQSVPFQNLDAYRPLAERAPEPQIAEAQRREFFAQLHRWLRQDYAVHVFCNNDGERQRFAEIWEEYGLGAENPTLHVGTLARGFLYDEGKLVVITDAEIFGRYKV